MTTISRLSSDKQRASLKMALARAVEGLGGGKAAAPLTRVNATMLSLYQAIHEDLRHAGLDVAFDLDLAHVVAGLEPPVASTYAALLDRELTRPGPGEAGGGALSIGDIIRVDRETWEARAAVSESLADGDISAAEKRRDLKEIDDAIASLQALRRKVEAA